MTTPNPNGPNEEGAFHTYTTHHIPWWVRAMWVVFWIGLIWYTVVFALPAAREFFK